MEIPSIPPGFESLAPFRLNRLEDNQIMSTTSCSASATAPEPIETDDAKITRSLRRRPWINYSRFDTTCASDSDAQQNPNTNPGLQKGVIRGCEECVNCQKVIARWRPEEACRPVLENAPVFYPTEEEFEDTLNYIASIRPRAEEYGICRIVPPPSWKPPCPLKGSKTWEHSKFATRIQKIDKLQNRDSMRKMWRANNNKRRKRRCMKMGVDYGNSSGDSSGPGKDGVSETERFGFEPGPEFTLDAFQKYADDFKAQYFRKNENLAQLGNDMTMLQERWEPSVENIEGEYWRMVENPTEEIEVLYGADLETGVFGSGFPKLSQTVASTSDEKYVRSGWNLNNFPRLPGSVLSYESSDISGVLVPWLYVGMCFSSFCWHVEDHHLYSLNYLHWGAPKLWYGVPGSDAQKLEAAMRKHLPDLFAEQPDLLHKLVTQLSPSILKSEGVPVYRCVQNPGEFVLTFPRAYHAGFNSGFNCAEAVNVAPVDWLPHGQNAIELYREQGRRTSISHDKLLLGAAREAVKAQWEVNLLRKNTSDNLRWKRVCGKDGILSKALKTRVEMERVRREFLCSSSKAVKMESGFDATSERECSVCLFDLHLSAAGCHCSPDRYACLNHAKQLCSCSWLAKFFLFRYDSSELSILVEALEGKLSAVYRWARLDLGLALSSSVSKDKQVSGSIPNVSHSPERTVQGDLTSLLPVTSFKKIKLEVKSEEIPDLNSVIGGTSLLKKEKHSGSEDINDMNASSTSRKSSNEIDRTDCSSEFKNGGSPTTLPKTSHEIEAENELPQVRSKGSSHSRTSSNTPVCQFLKDEVSYTDDVAAEKTDLKKPYFVQTNDVILLSDDEGEDKIQPLTKKEAETSGKLDDKRFAASSSGNRKEDPVLATTLTSAAVKGEGNAVSTKGEENRNDKVIVESNPQNQLCHGVSSAANVDNSVDNLLCLRLTNDIKMENAKGVSNNPQPCGTGKANCEDSKDGRLSLSLRCSENVQTGSGNSPYTQNNPDKILRQKGPRIAKVVRRINCNVESLEFGVLHSGKSWCDSRAIYPKGFRSRVKYINILDPTNMCYYISEILDVGRDEPLFMVSLEGCRNEVFVHVTAGRCWEMVRDRVNQEISKQHKLGKLKLPPLQPPGSLDGIEMFGFSSPPIVQAIQAMDRNRVCTEYWKSRTLIQIPQQCGVAAVVPPKPEEVVATNNNEKEKEEVVVLPLPLPLPPPATEEVQVDEAIISGLFKKANPQELHLLHTILMTTDNNNTTPPTSNHQALLTRLLRHEIHHRGR